MSTRRFRTRFALLAVAALAPTSAAVIVVAPVLVEALDVHRRDLDGQRDVFSLVVSPEHASAVRGEWIERLPSAFPGSVAAGARFMVVEIGPTGGTRQKAAVNFVTSSFFQLAGPRTLANFDGALAAGGIVVTRALGRKSIDPPAFRPGRDLAVGERTLPIAAIVGMPLQQLFGDGLPVDAWIADDRISGVLFDQAAEPSAMDTMVPPRWFIALPRGTRLGAVREFVEAETGVPVRLFGGLAADATRRSQQSRIAEGGLTIAAATWLSGAATLLGWSLQWRMRSARDRYVRDCLGARPIHALCVAALASMFAAASVAVATTVIASESRQALAAILPAADLSAPALAHTMWIAGANAVVIATAALVAIVPMVTRRVPAAPRFRSRRSAVILAVQGSIAAALLGAAIAVWAFAFESSALDSRLAAANVSVATLAPISSERDGTRWREALMRRDVTPEQVRDAVKSGVPADVAFGMSDTAPLSRYGARGAIASIDASSGANSVDIVPMLGVDRGYFEAVDLRLFHGSIDDFGVRGSNAVVLSHALAEFLCGGRACIGQRVHATPSELPESAGTWRVAAVVEDAVFAGGALGAHRVAYLPIGVLPVSELHVALHGPADMALEPIAPMLARTLPDGTGVRHWVPAARLVGDARSSDRRRAWLTAATVAVVLLVTLLQVTASTSIATVALRHELAIRRALGANARAVAWRLSRWLFAPCLFILVSAPLSHHLLKATVAELPAGSPGLRILCITSACTVLAILAAALPNVLRAAHENLAVLHEESR